MERNWLLGKVKFLRLKYFGIFNNCMEVSCFGEFCGFIEYFIRVRNKFFLCEVIESW